LYYQYIAAISQMSLLCYSQFLRAMDFTTALKCPIICWSVIDNAEEGTLMTTDPRTDISQQDGLNPLPEKAAGPSGPASPRTIEIMVYAVGLILAMIIAWYHDPHMFF
jgi:hypothetical protein